MSGVGHNTVRIHLTEGDVLTLERSLPDEVFRRSEAQHLISRIVQEARVQHLARENERRHRRAGAK